MMTSNLDGEVELLATAARRHLADLSPRASVHISAAADALLDPLSPPRFCGLDEDATTDLRGVLHAVRSRLLRAAHDAGDVQRTITLGLAARELALALASLDPGATAPQPSQAAVGTAATDADGTPPVTGR